MIVLKNTTRRMQTYNLDRAHSQIRSFPQVTALANGGFHGAMVKKKIIDSITFLAGETKSKWRKDEPIPVTMLQCPDIEAALARGDLKQITTVVDRSRYIGEAGKSSSASTPLGSRRNVRKSNKSNLDKNDLKPDQIETFTE